MPKATNWTGSDDQKTDVATRYKAGEGIRLLAASFKCRANVITQTLREAGFKLGKGGGNGKLTINQREEIIARYQAEQLPFKVLAAEYGVTAAAISSLLKKAGVKAEKWGTWTPERSAQIKAMWESGMSKPEIGRALNMRPSIVGFRLRQAGVPPTAPQSRERHGSWKGGRIIDTQGYIQTRPSKEELRYGTPNRSGYILEHRLVMGRVLGRPLVKTESVHHINGDKQDNRPENLQLRQGKHGTGVVMMCACCGSRDIVPAPLT